MREIWDEGVLRDVAMIYIRREVGKKEGKAHLDLPLYVH